MIALVGVSNSVFLEGPMIGTSSGSSAFRNAVLVLWLILD